MAMHQFRSLRAFAAGLLSCLVAACGGGGDAAPAQPGSWSAPPAVAQKGPLILGSTVSVQELTPLLAPTGRQYAYLISSDAGTFTASNSFGSAFVGVLAQGYYYDEVADAVSGGPATLSGYFDLGTDTSINVNVLTSLAYVRVQALVAAGGSFANARRQAQREVLEALNIRGFDSLGDFGALDLARGREGDHLLAAVSAVFVQGNTAGQASALLAAVQADIGQNGRITRPDIAAAVSAGARAMNPVRVAANLNRRYAASGAAYSADGIRAWIDADGDGVIASAEYMANNATPATHLELPAAALRPWIGRTVSVAQGRLFLNGVETTTAFVLRDGDRIELTPLQGNFADGVHRAYLLADGIPVLRASFTRGLMSIEVRPGATSLALGLQQPMAAAGLYTDLSETDLTPSAQWSSSNPGVASISVAGVVRALTLGVTTVAARIGDMTAATSLQVSAATLQSLTLRPLPLKTGVGVTRTLLATGTWSDGSQHELTQGLQWSSTAAAAVEPTAGNVTGLALGTATVTARSGAVVATATVNVTADQWVSGASLRQERKYDKALVLPDGRVFMGGGFGPDYSTSDYPSYPAIYDPVRDSWTTYSRPRQTMGSDGGVFLLDNGRVLMFGGVRETAQFVRTTIAYVHILNTATGQWTLGASMPNPRADIQPVKLLDGRVLVPGGYREFRWGPPQSMVEIYDPVADAWTMAAPMIVPRRGATSTLLQDGRVLVVGGIDTGFPEGGTNPYTLTATAELFDPVTGRWTAAGDVGVPRYRHAATLLRDGRVLITGGGGTPRIYDPVGASWSSAGDPPLHTTAETVAVLTRTGSVLVLNGVRADLFDPTTNTWRAVAPPSRSHVHRTAVLLPGGAVFLGGGAFTVDGEYSPVALVDLFW